MTLSFAQPYRLLQPQESVLLTLLEVEDYRACEREPLHLRHFAPSNPSPTIFRRGSSDRRTFSMQQNI